MRMRWLSLVLAFSLCLETGPQATFFLAPKTQVDSATDPNTHSLLDLRKAVGAALVSTAEKLRAPESSPALQSGESFFDFFFGSIVAVLEFLGQMFDAVIGKISRRAFVKRTVFAGTGAAVLNATGCRSSGGADRAENWQPYRNTLNHPRVLRYSVDQYLELMKDYNLQLKRLFLDWISADVLARLREEAGSDPVVQGSIAGVISGLSAAPAAGITVKGTPPYLPGVMYVDTQTNQTTNRAGDTTTIAPDNITAASRFVALPGGLPTQTRGFDSTPGFYWEIPLLGNQSAPTADLDRVVETVRRSLKAHVALQMHEVQQAYWRLVELKQDIGWLRELVANYEQRLASSDTPVEEKIILRERLNGASETKGLREKITDTEDSIRHAQTDLMEKTGFPRSVFKDAAGNDYFHEVTVETAETIPLEFDESRMPQYVASNVEDRIKTHSALLYRLDGELTLAAEAIGAMKDRASEPKIELILGFAPPTEAIVGARFEFRPLRNRAAEADILSWRVQHMNLRTQILQFQQDVAYRVRHMTDYRNTYLRRVREKKADYERATAAVAATTGKSQAQILTDQAALLEAKRAYLAALRDFNKFESERFVLEGQMVDDQTVNRLLVAMKEYHYNQYMQQEEIWFHGVFNHSALRGFFPWILGLIGLGIASSPTPARAADPVAAQRRGIPAIRWSAPEIAPVGAEPLFNCAA